MRIFSHPAPYRAFVESNLALIGAEIGRDVSRRSDEDVRVQNLATVPAQFYDASATGDVVVVVLDVTDETDVAQFADFIRQRAQPDDSEVAA